MRRFKKETYPFKRKDEIVNFFANFEDYWTEDQMWTKSEKIKPRGKKSKWQRNFNLGHLFWEKLQRCSLRASDMCWMCDYVWCFIGVHVKCRKVVPLMIYNKIHNNLKQIKLELFDICNCVHPIKLIYIVVAYHIMRDENAIWTIVT